MLVLKCIHCLWVILEIAIRGIKLDRQSSRGIDKERPNVTRFIALKRVRRTAGSFFLCVCLLVCFVLYVLVFFWWWWWWWCFLLLMVCFVIFFFFPENKWRNLDTLRRSLCICLCFLPEIMHTFFPLKRIYASLNSWCFMTVNLCLCCR